MKEKEFQDLLCDGSTTADEYFEIRSMLPQQVMRVLWDGFSNAIDTAETTKEYVDVDIASQMYSSLVGAANDLPELQADYWIGRADDYLPDFWCVWMQWLDQQKSLSIILTPS